jgi:hypothetical protein
VGRLFAVYGGAAIPPQAVLRCGNMALKAQVHSGIREKSLRRSGNTIIFEYSHAMRTRYRIGGVVAMRLVPWVVLAGAFGLLGQPALGFQETTVGGGEKPAQGKAPAEPKVAPTPGAGSLNLSIPDASSGKASGTEVRIPGIGTVGVLPKLDFGLELLYGATEPKGMAPEDRGHPEQNDLQIRGTIKHRF